MKKSDKVKILIVEDDPFLSSMYSTKFELEGLEVVVAENGRIGLEKANTESPDIILLDIIMPEKDGFSVLEGLKSNSNTKDVPVILLTNLNQVDDIRRAQSLGAADYMIKAHCMPSEIVERVRKFMSIKESSK